MKSILEVIQNLLKPYIDNADTAITNSLSAVATSGDYDDLSNKPSIPAAQVNADWNAASGVAQILNKPTLGTAAAKDSTSTVTQGGTDLVESGAVYGALENKADAPTIKTATLAANATTVTFTDMPTTGNNIISFYVDGGANYTAINTATAGEVTLTYAAESSARTVYCETKEVS